MKYAGVLFVFIVSLVLVSCSSLDQENPTTPQLQKPGGSSFTYPYNFLTEFKSVPVKELIIFDGAVRVVTGEVPFQIEQMFAVFESSQDGEVGSSLFFLENPGTGEFSISGLGDHNYGKVRVYALQHRNVPDLITNFPYNYLQSFDFVSVDSWSVSGTNIKLSSENINSVSQAFAEITYKDGKILVYLGRQTDSTFEIPVYGGMGVTDVQLFGYSGPFLNALGIKQ